MGGSFMRIVSRHLMPRVAPLAAAQFVRVATMAMLMESSLAFLGLGDVSSPSLGTMMYFANTHNAILTGAWVWWMLPAGLSLTLAVLGFAFLGYAIEEWADPRLVGAVLPTAAMPHSANSKETAIAVDTVLCVSDLIVSYHTPRAIIRAVDGVSLSLGRARIAGLIGESGCGKITLATALIGLVRHPGRVESGSIVVGGHDLGALPPREAKRILRREIGFIPQNAMNALNPIRTVRRQVGEITALSLGLNSRVEELLDAVEIARTHRNSYPHELSGGMRQRIAIAMALASNPSVVIADEPFTGLDVLTQAGILKLLSELRMRRSVSILLISHDLSLVSRIADDVFVMYAGRIVEYGPASSGMINFVHPYTRALARAIPRLRGSAGTMTSIAGEPPSLANPPCGCRFHPRCPVAFERCRALEPGLLETIPGHRVACHLV